MFGLFLGRSQNQNDQVKTMCFKIRTVNINFLRVIKKTGLVF